MRFVINQEDIKLYKHLIALALSSVDSTGANPIEGCIELSTKEESSEVMIRTLNSSCHSCLLTCPATIQQSGSTYIHATSLSEMTKRLDKSSLVVSMESNKLTYTVPVLGSISEGIHHNQGGFSYGVLNPREKDAVEMDLVVENSSILANVIKSASSIALRDKPIRVVSTKDHLDLYLIHSEAGSVRYRDLIECEKSIDIALDSISLKIISLLGNVLSLYIDKEGRTVRFSSDMGSITLLSSLSNSGEYKSMEAVLKKTPSSTLEIKYEDIEAAIKWQSYKAEKGQGVNIALSTSLSISTGRLGSPSTLTASSFNGEESQVCLSLEVLTKVLSAVRGEKVSIERRVIPIGTKNINIVSIHPSKKDNGYGIATINEQVII
jgi:hypothetical protein